MDEGLVDMTGYACEKLKYTEKDYERKKEEIWNFLRKNQDDGCLMGCSVTAQEGAIESEYYIDDEKSGIVCGHAYAITNVLEMPDEEMQNDRRTHRLLLIRNPWGSKEWQFDWSGSEFDEKMEKHKDKIINMINEMEKDERFDPYDDDGLFFMNYKSFRSVFDKVFVAINFPDEWSAVRYKAKWTHPEQCVMKTKPKKGVNPNYTYNPQYKIKPEVDIELFVSLSQNDGRLKCKEMQKNGGYDKYPFAEKVIWTQLSVFELHNAEDDDEQMDRIKFFDTKKLIPDGKSPLRQSADNSLRVNLYAGNTYVIVPAPVHPGTGVNVKYNLSLYFSTSMHNVEIEHLQQGQEKQQKCK